MVPGDLVKCLSGFPHAEPNGIAGTVIIEGFEVTVPLDNYYYIVRESLLIEGKEYLTFHEFTNRKFSTKDGRMLELCFASTGYELQTLTSEEIIKALYPAA